MMKLALSSFPFVANTILLLAKYNGMGWHHKPSKMSIADAQKIREQRGYAMSNSILKVLNMICIFNVNSNHDENGLAI